MKYKVDVGEWVAVWLFTLAWLAPVLAAVTVWMGFLMRNE
jgi:hypothetical protein